MDKEKEVKPYLIQYRGVIYRRLKITDQVSGHIEVNVDEDFSIERAKREEADKKAKESYKNGEEYAVGYMSIELNESNKKINELEAKVKELEEHLFTCQGMLLSDQTKLATAKEELETERLRLATCGVVGWSENLENANVDDKYKSDSLDAVVNLVNKLATANAKIVELEKKCKNLDAIIGSLDVKDPNACDALLNVQLINQNTIKGLKAELSTANKKVADLEESLEVENERAQVFVDLANKSNKKAEKLVEALEYFNSKPLVINMKVAEQALKEFRGENTPRQP